MTEKTILTSPEAAKFLGVSEGALRQMRYKHTIPYYKNKTGKFAYYLKSELEEWMLATRIATADEVEAEALKDLNV